VGLGEPVRLRVGELVHEGRLADLGRDGSILLESPAGCLVRFTAGELFLGEVDGSRAATAPAAEASRPATGRL
jgi:hypothetical protein